MGNSVYKQAADLITGTHCFEMSNYIYLVTGMRRHIGGLSQLEDVLEHHQVRLAAGRAHQLVLGQPLLVLLVARVPEKISYAYYTVPQCINLD